MNPIERRIPTLLIARRNLSRTKMRSILAMLGIAIGVLAIASLGVFGATLAQSVTKSLGDIGNQIVVNPASNDGPAKPLTDQEVQEITRVSSEASVIPIKQASSQVSYRGESTQATLYGMTDPAPAYDAARGRIPLQFRSGALIGSELAESLGVSVGDSLTVGSRRVRILAVLESSPGLSTIDPDSAVVLPTPDVAGDGYDSVIVTAASSQRANETAIAIREELNERDRRVRIIEFRQIIKQIKSVFDAINLFLIAIASISLLVAGVSILNVMLMSTIVRQEEIGVLRAVGYQQRDVLKIILLEALLVGMVGGGAGAVLSFVGGLAMAQLLLGDATAVLTPTNAGFIMGSLVFGVLTSVVSGLYPARQAATKEPVDALRG
jgi:putative ABC transport system permease protein